MQAAILLLGGVTMLGTGAWFALEHIDYAWHAQRAEGVVTGTVVKRVRGSKLYHPVVRFSAPTGGEHQFTERAGLFWPSHEEGEAVEVLYFEDRPEAAKVNSFRALWLIPLVLGAFGAACLAAGISSWPRSKAVVR